MSELAAPFGQFLVFDQITLVYDLAKHQPAHSVHNLAVFIMSENWSGLEFIGSSLSGAGSDHYTL